jgi:hypothetical protein
MKSKSSSRDWARPLKIAPVDKIIVMIHAGISDEALNLLLERTIYEPVDWQGLGKRGKISEATLEYEELLKQGVDTCFT